MNSIKQAFINCLKKLAVVVGSSLVLFVAPASVGQSSATQKTIWDGVYTKEQSERGAPAYKESCAICHETIDAPPPGPPLQSDEFLRGWNNKTIKDLYDNIRGSMPQNNPGSLSVKTYLDIMAFLLQGNGIPPGGEELPKDSAAQQSIKILRQKP